MSFVLWNPASPAPGSLCFDVTSREGEPLGRPGLPWFTACARLLGLSAGVREARITRARADWLGDDSADWRSRWARVWTVRLELDDPLATLPPAPVLERVVCGTDDPGIVAGAWNDRGGDDRGFSALQRRYAGEVLVIAGFDLDPTELDERVVPAACEAIAATLPHAGPPTAEVWTFAPAEAPPDADDLEYYRELGEDGDRFLRERLARARPLRLLRVRLPGMRLPADEGARRAVLDALRAAGGTVRRHALVRS